MTARTPKRCAISRRFIANVIAAATEQAIATPNSPSMTVIMWRWVVIPSVSEGSADQTYVNCPHASRGHRIGNRPSPLSNVATVRLRRLRGLVQAHGDHALPRRENV